MERICRMCNENCKLSIMNIDGKYEVKGQKCEEGLQFIKKIIELDEDILTTLVRIKGSSETIVVPVKSSGPIKKNLHVECSKALSRLYIGPPVKIGDIICKNILNTGMDIICTKNINK